MDENAFKEILTGRWIKREALMTYLLENANLADACIVWAVESTDAKGWRAAWLLYHYTKKRQAFLQPHIQAFLDAIPLKKEGHQRELLKLLEPLKLNDFQEGQLFDICMTIWEKISHSPSVRITAFRILLQIAKRYPELKTELLLFMGEDYTSTLSSGILQSFERLKKNAFKT